MIDQLFEFEREVIPAPVIVATAALIAIFVVGVALRAIAFLVF